jgi:hypothetical protein
MEEQGAVVGKSTMMNFDVSKFIMVPSFGLLHDKRRFHVG